MFDEVKALAAEWLGQLYEPLVYLGYALFPFFGAHVLNFAFVASAVLLAAWFYLRKAERDTPASTRGFVGFLLPRRVFLHPSALLDYRFYLVNAVLLSYVRLSARVAGFVGLFYVADNARGLLTAVFGPGSSGNAEASFAAQATFTLAMVLAVDFSKFFAHFLQHKLPVLWEFHKVHHSAEVLTPLTNYRLHPVDVMLEQFLVALLAGVVVGVSGYFHSSGLVELTILNIGAIQFVYFLAANLRHSHIPLAFGWRTSHVLSSPYMHQIHHSSEVRHWDRNYALIFSFWDVLFRSIYVPRGREEFRLGLSGAPTRQFGSVWGLYASPFVAAGRRIAAGRSALQARLE